jgi:PAS domain S-box-containing protein
LWGMTAAYFAATTLGDAHDFLIDVGLEPPIILPIAAFIGWCSYMPLAYLVFFPVADGLNRQRRWLMLVDLAQVTIAVGLLYFLLVYLPHSQAGVPWIRRGRPELVRNVLISVGLLLRASLDPSHQARAVYRRVGGAFGVITASILFLGPTITVVVRPAALFALGLLAFFWRGGPEREPVSQRGLIGTRLALGIVAAANLIVVVLLAAGAPERYRPIMYAVAGVSTILFVVRSMLIESRRYDTELELRTSEQRYAKTFKASPDGIAIRHLGDAGLIEVNERLASMLRYAPEELVGRTLVELGIVEPDDGGSLVELVERTGGVRDFEFGVRRRDGVRLAMVVSAEMVEIDRRRCALMIFRDVTAQKRAEAEVVEAAEERRRLYVRLARVEDDERRVLHTELHDRVGANLAALRLELEVAANLLGREDRHGAERHLVGARGVAVETIAIARDIMTDLRPPSLDDYGLAAALRAFAEAQSARLNVRIDVGGELDGRRPARLVENALFRIAHEAVMNAARHASATRVAITLAERDGRIVLTIADDGLGFDPDAPAAGPDHWGLKNMRERAQSVGGTLLVESAPGAGTRIMTDAPRETE